jgi:GT2 family glycosyltransferase
VGNDEHGRRLLSRELVAASTAEGSVATIGVHDEGVGSESLELAPVSAIIVTKGRPEELRRTVQTLLEGNVFPSEVIVVDQSTDQRGHDAVHEEFRKVGNHRSLLPHLRYILEPSIRGISEARNAGMALAQEQIWLFLDDDVIMEPDFVKELMNAYADPAPVGGVSGIITNYALKPITHRVWLWIFERGPLADPRQPLYWNAKTLNETRNIEVPFLTGALMSFRAEAIRGFRFDDGAGICHCDDIDYCLQLGKNIRLVMAPRARLEHMISPKARGNAHWIRLPTLSYSFLYRRHFSARMADRIRFYWLCVGLVFWAATSSFRRFSLEPWRTFVSALREGLSAGRESASAASVAATGTMVAASGRARDESASAGGMNGRTA